MLPDLSRTEVETRLAGPVDAYYDALDAANAQTGFFRGITSRLAIANARVQVRRDLTDLVAQAHLVAAIQGNNGEALSDEQNAAVMQRIADSQSYLNGFLADLPTNLQVGMTRQQAVTRIQLYSAAIIQTESVVGSIGKPTLPIYPGDPSLDCSHRGPWCHCRLRWTKLAGNGNWDVDWLLDSAVENCDSCVTLSKDWSPLEIRHGKIVNNKNVKTFQRAYLAAMLDKLGVN